MATKEDIQVLIQNLTDDKITLSAAFLKAKALNKRVKNKELTDFIIGEVEEKYNNNTLPEYRLIWGESTFKFKNINTGSTEIRNLPLPEATHFNGKSINYRPILFSISEIEQVVSINDKSNKIKIPFTPSQLDVAQKYLDQLISNSEQFELISAWWSHSPTSFPTILFRIKQKLIDILGEIENSFLKIDHEEKLYSDKTQFDASFEIVQIIKKAKNNIILIDGFVDGTTLQLLSSKKENVSLQILTDPKALLDSFKVLINKFNDQYKDLEVRTTKSFHDRFLILDKTNFYQIGTSLKDLGNKSFTFIKLKETFIIDGLMNKFDKEWNKTK